MLTLRLLLYFPLQVQLEKENMDLENSHHKLERENKSLNKEVDRLKQSIEVKDANVEDINSKLVNLQKEKIKLVNDLEHWNGQNSKVRQISIYSNIVLTNFVQNLCHNNAMVFFRYYSSRDLHLFLIFTMQHHKLHF